MPASFTRSTLLHVFAALLGVGCASSALHAPPAPSALALVVPYGPRATNAAAAGPARAPRTTPADDAAFALGLPPLAEAALPDGTRELRMSDWYSMIFGTPVRVLRLVERPGRPAAGQVVSVWREHAGRRAPARYRATRCTPWADSLRTCAYVSPVALDWPAVAAQLAALGAWTMTAPCEDTVFYADGGELLISRLTGARADAYGCNAPQYRQSTTVGREALALLQYLHAVLGQAAGPPAG